jgi:DNA-binding NtrC family response regulator
VYPTKPHILLVDGEDSLRFSIAENLTCEGFEVEAAANAEEATEKLTRTAYDVVVTDLMLAGKSGVALLEETLVRSPETIVIMMGCHATIETVVDAMKKGAYDYVNKPSKLYELPTMIRKGLKESRPRQTQVRDKYCFVELPEEGIDFQNVVSGMERELIAQSLRRTNGNKKLAAKLLSLKRTTLIEKIKRIGLREDLSGKIPV